ncbi:MAG: hypothetical protein HY901_04190 [Deltaproteobacteria bacterium]|nr:hypothetical protein [Deltaproteobacteria bacterium]
MNLKIKGNGQKGRARVFVDEWSGALSIREQDVRAHDKGGHSGHGRGHGHHDDRDDDD